MDYGNYSEENTHAKLSATNYPSPANLEEFLPWACKQWQLPFTPVVKRIELQSFCTSVTPKPRKGQKLKEDLDTDSDARSTALSDLNNGEVGPGVVNIYTVYDTNKNLQQLKFLKNCKVPNILIKLIALAVPFHPHLNGIYIDSGLNQSGIYELTKILSLSKVTEVTLDNTFLVQGNYYLLLGENSHLKYISLARCKINDAVLQNIALRLSDSQDLYVLNLASNRITDKGAEYLGNTLKYNRKLSYLNLSDNTLTDIGATSILNSLQEFPLTTQDITDKRTRYMNYLKQKNITIKKIINDMRVEEFEKQISARRKMRKSIAPTPLKKGKTLESTPQFSEPVIDQTWYDKAEAFAVASLGTFTDAFSSDNTVIKGDVVYCLGNNTLCCLNLAYNNLSYISVKKIHDVLRTQDRNNRSPKGLLKICIDGNNIPEYCLELSEIETMLGSTIGSSQKACSVTKKKPISRVSTKSGIL